MRCRDAREWLEAQSQKEFEPGQADELRDHLKQCASCRMHQEQLQKLDALLRLSIPQMKPSISHVSTEQIMRTIQQRSQISQQLEELRTQQRTRMSQIQPLGTVLAAIIFFSLSCLPLGLLALVIIQSDTVVQLLTVGKGLIDILVVLSQYLQSTLQLVTQNNWLLAALALAVVVMSGMWLRLMRHPQEA
ncbi:hypothetical protein EI42_00993 [Thermosporothrix hazakensis]|jgi:predicted anti-sigma-YlaC factor YlaD|uniref:Uncharacterized protein n=2 Tax=Thermosporothrix TaxID=768650 RepID=A0A326UEF3_THEHA|nr:zf-HC2 domain-containing protein [Thermosporothrix hazakensis]PZW36807.1 hypothetical protein EI42_00993 [Thermosporothrix hazakensis]BBH89273.1 hypothetical protein KTC_40240 [Thermosporothrix sp. COM3]GCE47456.1 hypothetical protein KTH_23250 [Thermosporothrix hazakensis]